MKKVTKIISLALIVAALLTSACGCNSEQINTNPADKTKESSSVGETCHTSMEEDQAQADFESYDSIIQNWRMIVDLCPGYSNEKDRAGEYDAMFHLSNEATHKIYSSLFNSTLIMYPKDYQGCHSDGYASFGYAIQDVNRDGFEELVLMLNDQTILAVFSKSALDGKPVLLGNFWNRNTCRIDTAGRLHISGSNGADRLAFSVYQISPDREKLLLLEECGLDGHDEEKLEAIYYQIANGEKVHISEAEYNEFRQNSPYRLSDGSIEKYDGWQFTPLFDENNPPHPVGDPRQNAKG